MTDALQILLDENAIRRAACVYAQGADRRDAALWRSVMTDDISIVIPGLTMEGVDKVLAGLDFLKQHYVATQHQVLNQLFTIEGDRAWGETYCQADHLSEGDGGRTLLTWAIRYQDELRRIDGAWRFSRRELILDWADERSIG